MSGAVVVCEPKRGGPEHGRVNAGFLAAAARLAAPGPVYFVRTAAHGEAVRASLAGEERAACAAVRGVDTRLAGRNAPFRRRVPREAAAAARAFRLAARHRAALVLFTSVDAGSLAALLAMRRITRCRAPVLGVQHNAFRAAAEEAGRGRRAGRLSFPRLLERADPAGFRCLVLGASILDPVRRLWPAAAERCAPVDMPYTWSGPVRDDAPAPRDPVRFGFLGVSTKGWDGFLDVARRVRARRPGRCAFSLVGYLNDPAHRRDAAAARALVPDAGAEPLSPAAYDARGRAVTYVVGTSPASLYAYRFNATLLDAIGLRRPGLYLRNPCLDHYFDRCGAMGYLCGDLADMEQRMLALVDAFPGDAYRRQQACLDGARPLFAPARAAEALGALRDAMRARGEAP